MKRRDAPGNGILRSAQRAVSGAAAVLCSMLAIAQPADPLTLVQTIALPDVRGRIDHLDIDLEGNRLFVAALGNKTVEVIDLRAGRRSTRIESEREPQGVAYVPDGGRLFVANGEGARVDIFSGATLERITSIGDLEDADNLRYEPASGRIFAGYGSALAVLAVPTAQKVADIKLAGHPEAFQLEGLGSRIFINVPGARQIAVVDRKSSTVVATWRVDDLAANFPMALDEVTHRLFVATRRPAALLAYDTETARRIASMPTCGDADDLFFDGARKRLYVICGEGVVYVVQQQDADRYEMAGQVRTVRGARTGLFVPTQKTLYVALPAQGVLPAEVRAYRVN